MLHSSPVKNDKEILDNVQGESFKNYFESFSEKLQRFQFAPPSDNLWSIKICVADRNGMTTSDNKNNLL